MNKINERHLPQLNGLKEYPENDWIIFGCLTYRHDTASKEQINDFIKLMNFVARRNGFYGDNLHYVARIEGGHGNAAASGKGQARRHIHFALSGYKVTTAKWFPWDYTGACEYIKNNWPHGGIDLQPFIPNYGGLEYILKVPNDPKAPENDDPVIISKSLVRYLKIKKNAPPTRDPFALELVNALRATGTKVYFGDEVPSWKESAA
jgi:hypothetical protein